MDSFRSKSKYFLTLWLLLSSINSGNSQAECPDWDPTIMKCSTGFAFSYMTCTCVKATIVRPTTKTTTKTTTSTTLKPTVPITTGTTVDPRKALEPRITALIDNLTAFQRTVNLVDVQDKACKDIILSSLASYIASAKKLQTNLYTVPYATDLSTLTTLEGNLVSIRNDWIVCQAKTTTTTTTTEDPRNSLVSEIATLLDFLTELQANVNFAVVQDQECKEKILADLSSNIDSVRQLQDNLYKISYSEASNNLNNLKDSFGLTRIQWTECQTRVTTTEAKTTVEPSLSSEFSDLIDEVQGYKDTVSSADVEDKECKQRVLSRIETLLSIIRYDKSVLFLLESAEREKRLASAKSEFSSIQNEWLKCFISSSSGGPSSVESSASSESGAPSSEGPSSSSESSAPSSEVSSSAPSSSESSTGSESSSMSSESSAPSSEESSSESSAPSSEVSSSAPSSSESSTGSESSSMSSESSAPSSEESSSESSAPSSEVSSSAPSSSESSTGSESSSMSSESSAPSSEESSSESSAPSSKVSSSAPSSSESSTGSESSSMSSQSSAPSSEESSSESSAPSSEVSSSAPSSSESSTGSESSSVSSESSAPSSEESSSESSAPSSEAPSSESPTSESQTSESPTSESPTSESPTSEPPTSESPSSEVSIPEVSPLPTPWWTMELTTPSTADPLVCKPPKISYCYPNGPCIFWNPQRMHCPDHYNFNTDFCSCMPDYNYFSLPNCNNACDCYEYLNLTTCKCMCTPVNCTEFGKIWNQDKCECEAIPIQLPPTTEKPICSIPSCRPCDRLDMLNCTCERREVTCPPKYEPVGDGCNCIKSNETSPLCPGLICMNGPSINEARCSCTLKTCNGTCPTGYLMDLDTCECACGLKEWQCPAETPFLDDFNCRCIRPICDLISPCPDDTKWNSDTCRCECIDPPTCPLHNFVLDLPTCQCVCVNETCPPGHILNELACICVPDPDPSCPNKLTYDHDKCECVCAPESRICEYGLQWDETECDCICVKNEVCLDQFFWDQDKCQCVCNATVINTQCQANQTFDYLKCQCIDNPIPSCQRGFVYNSTLCDCVCAETKLCVGGNIFDPDLCDCVCPEVTECSDGMEFNIDLCQCILIHDTSFI